VWIGVGVMAVAIPFIVFFAVWAITIYLFAQLSPDAIVGGIVIGFIAGIVASRALVKKALNLLLNSHDVMRTSCVMSRPKPTWK
jgi:hypothetical protein